jgi:hypothetical protein
LGEKRIEPIQLEGSRNMRWFLTAVAIFVVLSASPTCAQSDFTGLRAQPGDRIHVTQPSGIEVEGVLTEVSSTELRIDGYTFAPEAGLRVDRQGDSVWSGTLIGTGVGVLLGVALGECGSAEQWRCIAGAGATYGLIGALIDWAHEGRTTIFRGKSPRGARLMPLVTPSSGSLSVAFSF